MRKDHPRDPPHIFSKGRMLITFIRELFCKDYAIQILNSVPDNAKSKTKFPTAFSNAVICFTHFGKMTETTLEPLHMRCWRHLSDAWRSFAGLHGTPWTFDSGAAP